MNWFHADKNKNNECAKIMDQMANVQIDKFDNSANSVQENRYYQLDTKITNTSVLTTHTMNRCISITNYKDAVKTIVFFGKSNDYN